MNTDVAALKAAGLVEVRDGVRGPTPFGSALTTLMRATNCLADLTVDHGRWRLYQESLGQLDLLYAAVALEPDVPLRKAVVVRVLELVDDHSRWLALVPGDRYAERRSREIGVLRRASTLGAAEIDLDGWSDWLQLRLAEVPQRGLLVALAEGGRTQRIRRTADATLHSLR